MAFLSRGNIDAQPAVSIGQAGEALRQKALDFKPPVML
jgi:hypothetical protein